MKVLLYQYNDPGIDITIKAYFENEDLVIEGYDIGSTVEAAWGDSDYEYSRRIKQAELIKLYNLLKISVNDKQGLLTALNKKYHSNTCYSEICKLLDDNNISSEGFSWT